MTERYYGVWEGTIYGVGIEDRVRSYHRSRWRSENTLDETIRFASEMRLVTIVTVVE